jgi:hypothetical protein
MRARFVLTTCMIPVGLLFFAVRHSHTLRPFTCAVTHCFLGGFADLLVRPVDLGTRSAARLYWIQVGGYKLRSRSLVKAGTGLTA